MRDSRRLPALRALRWVGALLIVVLLAGPRAGAEPLRVRLTGRHAGRVTVVGAVQRWDANGNALQGVDPKARIGSPKLTATARRASPQPSGGTTWVFENLAPGRYDLVLLTEDRRRIEGFTFVPVLEFDPVLASDRQPPDQVRRKVEKQIALAKHYENKVTPLYFAGDDKAVRVFVQLLRDEATSFDAEFGEPVATLRHELWQFTNQYGGWVKEKRTRVFDRVLLAKSQLPAWSWSWDPQLGGIEVDAGAQGEAREVVYAIPDPPELHPENRTGKGSPAR